MSSIALKIMLHGLIALVPDKSTGADHMTALLLDARTPTGIECITAHEPQLVVMVENAIQCREAGCKVKGDHECTCTDSLAGKDIALELDPAPNPAGKPLNKDVLSHLPIDSDEAGLYSNITNLSQSSFGMKLKRQYLEDLPPINLLSRMKFPFDEVTACALAKREDGGTANIHGVSFRKLHAEGQAGESFQPLAQMVAVDINLNSDGQDLPHVTLTLRDFGTETIHPLVLMPEDKSDGSGQFYMITLSNDADSLRPDSPCDDGVGRHFALFYEFAESPLRWADRLLPHIRPAQSKSPVGLVPAACNDPHFNLMDRPMCPMASFDHP